MVEAVVKFVKSVVTGELEDLQETSEDGIIEDVVTLSGRMHFMAEFVIQICIYGLTPVFFALVEADYSCHSSIALAAGTGAEGSKDI